MLPPSLPFARRPHCSQVQLRMYVAEHLYDNRCCYSLAVAAQGTLKWISNKAKKERRS